MPDSIATEVAEIHLPTTLRRTIWTFFAASALLWPDLWRSTVAVAAGSLFEAAPFVLLGAALPARLRAPVAALGCGCGGALPGALAPAAIATCWLGFGPLVTLARVAAGLAALYARRGRRSLTVGSGKSAASRPERTAGGDEDDPFPQLLGIGACAAAAGPLAGLIAHQTSGPLQFVAGLILGMLVPCATAGVALASGAAHPAPPLAAALLLTTGIAPRPSLGRFRFDPFAAAARTRRDGRFALALLVAALGALIWRGPGGLIHPRLVPFAGAGAVAAAFYLRRRPRVTASAAAVPMLMLLALAGGSPAPAYVATETTAADGFAGEPASFSGVVRAAPGPRSTQLARFAITCCRLDATLLEMPLDRALRVVPGTWVAARGRLIRRGGTLVLGVESWRTIPAPADPFVYR